MSEAFNFLEQKVKELESKEKEYICALVFDEISIMNKITLQGEKIRGYVDLGFINDHAEQPDCAKNAFVVMVVSITEKWKLPISYFFINTLNAEQRKNIILESISRLH